MMIDPATLTAIARKIGIRGGIAIALGLALVFTMLRADSLSDQRDAAKEALAAETARHDVTRASLTLLADKLEAMVKDGELRGEARDKALTEVHEETEALREQADGFDILTVEGL